MTKWHKSYDEAHCHLQQAGFLIDYDPTCQRRQYRGCCIQRGTGASAALFLTSY